MTLGHMSGNRRTPARIVGRAIHAMLVPFPIACFVLTLMSDMAYWKTASMQWANMSAWLLTVGLVIALFAAIAGLVDFLGDQRFQRLPAIYLYAVGNGLALLLAIANAFIHSRDAYTSVVPTGLTLSALTVLFLVVTSWMRWRLVDRQRVGARSEGDR